MVNSMLYEFHLDEKYTQNKLILQIPFCDKMTHVFNSQELNKQLTWDVMLRDNSCYLASYYIVQTVR